MLLIYIVKSGKRLSSDSGKKSSTQNVNYPLSFESQCWQCNSRGYNISVNLLNICDLFCYIGCSILLFYLCKIDYYPSELCFRSYYILSLLTAKRFMIKTDSKNIHSFATHSEIFQKTNPCVAICDYFSCLLTFIILFT